MKIKENKVVPVCVDEVRRHCRETGEIALITVLFFFYFTVKSSRENQTFNYPVIYIISPVKANSTVEADQVLVGQVTKILPDQGLLVRLPTYKCGLVALTDLRDSYVENPLDNFEVMQLLRYAVTFITHCVLYF